MNMAHAHLVLNHIPLIAIPVALAFLLHSLWTRNFPARRFAYLVLLVAAAAVVPVFLTGEPAEHIVEHLPGVSEALIEPHEEAADISLVLTLLAGAAAFFGLIAGEHGFKSTLARNAALGTSIAALASLAYTANLGGKIRHPELRGDVALQSADTGPADEPGHAEGDDD